MPSAKTSRSMVPTSTPAKRALSASASAWVNTGAVSITSIWRAVALTIGQFRMAQPPDRHRGVGRVLIDVRITRERRLHVGIVERHVRSEAVEPAAAHEEHQVHQHVADGLD